MKPRDFKTLAEMTKWTLDNPGAYHVIVLHDDGCPSISEEDECTCDPDYVVEDLTADTFLAGQSAERAWRSTDEVPTKPIN